MSKFIFVKFQKEGIHSYPDAPDEVAFLRNPHRHMFHFKVTLSVTHDDRDIEFIMLKRELEGLYTGVMSVNYQSCEMLAGDLIKYINEKYPGRHGSVEVNEDNENGAIIHFKAEEKRKCSGGCSGCSK